MDLWGSDGLTTELGELPGQKVQSKARSWEGLHHSLIVTVASASALRHLQLDSQPAAEEAEKSGLQRDISATIHPQVFVK
ncbi:cortexin-3 isoform X8 [Panthera tigris]|uniref:cortexin-3 isoform X8 n=1 Tax=Panthera tigris TaxID=9694 RepID=UPI001C6FC052|nr:cortexin-3 isoform X8 [Panthera tigris]